MCLSVWPYLRGFINALNLTTIPFAFAFHQNISKYVNVQAKQFDRFREYLPGATGRFAPVASWQRGPGRRWPPARSVCATRTSPFSATGCQISLLISKHEITRLITSSGIIQAGVVIPLIGSGWKYPSAWRHCMNHGSQSSHIESHHFWWS